MTKLLKAPENVLSASVDGKQVQVVDGCCEVQDHEVAQLLAHGFTLLEAGSAHDPRPPAEGKEMSPLDVSIAMLSRAERPELFAIAKGMGVALTATMKTEAMREALIAESRKNFKGDEKPPAEVKKQAAADAAKLDVSKATGEDS